MKRYETLSGHWLVRCFSTDMLRDQHLGISSKAIQILTQCQSKTNHYHTTWSLFFCQPCKSWTRGNSVGSPQQDQLCYSLWRAIRCRVPTLRKRKSKASGAWLLRKRPKAGEQFCRGSRQLLLRSSLFLFLSKLTAFWKFSSATAVMVHVLS